MAGLSNFFQMFIGLGIYNFDNRADKFRLEFLPFHFKFRSVPRRKKILLFSHILIKTFGIRNSVSVSKYVSWQGMERFGKFIRICHQNAKINVHVTIFENKGQWTFWHFNIFANQFANNFFVLYFKAEFLQYFLALFQQLTKSICLCQ